jgi:uncharacterized protein YndB with AHSA1/START domain
MPNNTWTCEHSAEIAASSDTIWTLFTDVAGWPRWNAGIERIELTGAFQTGAIFSMTVPGQPPVTMTTRLIEVRPRESFIDETVVGDLVIVVSHRLEPRGPARTTVVYAMTATGPGAEEVGPAVSSDFPEVLSALKGLAERITDAAASRPRP